MLGILGEERHWVNTMDSRDRACEFSLQSSLARKANLLGLLLEHGDGFPITHRSPLVFGSLVILLHLTQLRIQMHQLIATPCRSGGA